MHTKARTLALGTLASLSLVGLALAATSSVKFYINGQKNALDAIVVNGKTYVPVSALKAAGLDISATASAVNLKLAAAGANTGGANQMTALEGCVNQTLFNGVWRMKVTSVTQGEVNGRQGWLVGVQMSNGTPRPQYVYGTGLSNSNEAYTLATPDGDTGVWSTFYTLNDFADRNVPQGALFNYTFKFFPVSNDNTTAPTKFLMRVNTQYINKKEVPYSVPDPSFRIDLTCKK